MAYGQFTGYEPGPAPGSYLFQRANGSPLVFGGSEAEQLKARLDASNATNMVAGPGGGPPPDTEPAAAAPAAPPTPKPIAPEAGMKPFMQNGINTGYLQGPDGRLYEQTVGAPGVSQKQLQAKAGQGVALPTSQTESVTGGFEPNQDYIEGRSNARIDANLALDRQRQADLQAEAEGRKVAEERFKADTAALTRQEEMVSAVMGQVNEAQARRDQALKDYTGTKIDPQRIFHGQGGDGRRAISAIASALGAYASTIGRTQNFAQQIIDQNIARDISAQEADLRTKKDASDTALGDLVRRGMTLEQAKGTLDTIQRRWWDNKVQLARGASNDESINAKYDALLANNQQRALDEDERYRRDALGTAQKSVSAQVAYPQAGSAGGVRPVSAAKGLQIAGQAAGTESTVAGTAQTLNKLEGGAGNTPNKAKALAGIEASKSALLKLKEKWIAAGKPGVWTTGFFGSDTSQALGADVESMAPGLGRGLEGNAPNESTMEAIREGLLSKDPTKIEASIDSYLERLEEQKKSLVQTPGDVGGATERATP